MRKPYAALAANASGRRLVGRGRVTSRAGPRAEPDQPLLVRPDFDRIRAGPAQQPFARFPERLGVGNAVHDIRRSRSRASIGQE
jgi:hypothetical protein